MASKRSHFVKGLADYLIKQYKKIEMSTLQFVSKISYYQVPFNKGTWSLGSQDCKIFPIKDIFLLCPV